MSANVALRNPTKKFGEHRSRQQFPTKLT